MNSISYNEGLRLLNISDTVPDRVWVLTNGTIIFWDESNPDVEKHGWAYIQPFINETKSINNLKKMREVLGLKAADLKYKSQAVKRSTITAQRLHAIKVILNLSWAELANKLGITSAHLMDYMRCNQMPPGSEALEVKVSNDS
jgi:DNA-binding transcriptional regulator YiaG